MPLKLYNSYKEDFTLKDCTLLTTEEEFETMKDIRNKTFRIQYKCGHICDKCWYDIFMSRGSNSTCRINLICILFLKKNRYL